MQEMALAILGGSFDPPHIGHYLVAKQILDYRHDIDRILLMPAFQHQWKPIVANVTDRLAMLKNLEEERIRISDIELQRKGVSYTLDTIKQVKKESGSDVFWIVGSDILNEFDKWDKTENITDHAKFLVFPRDPYHLPEHLPNGFDAVREPSLITSNISSTVIRTRLKEGKSITYFVPGSIEQYINEMKLYAER